MDAATNPVVRVLTSATADGAASSSQIADDYTYRRRSSAVKFAADGITAVAVEPIDENATSNFQKLSLEEVRMAATSEENFPEGGLRAWSVVVGACFTLFSSFGFQVSIGTFQDYLQRNQLKAYSARDVGWIPSIFVYLGLALGIAVGPLFDRYGPRYIALVGSCLYITMIFLLAECKDYWQFILCCGFLGGIAAALLVTTSLAAVAHWFKLRRGFAQGIAMVGSSFGGLTIPLILRATFPKYGYRRSIQILGVVFAGCLLLGNLLLRSRLPRNKSAKKQPIVSLSIFSDLRFSLLAVSVFGFEVVLFGALGILPTYASISTDFPADTGFYLISVMNGVSCLGRAVPGYIADRIGRFNTLLISLVLTLVFMVALWLPLGDTSLPALYIFVALFGFGTGCWMALTPACIGQLCRADEFGRYYGSLYFVASLSTLICIPISGELVEAVGPKPMVGFMCAVLLLSIATFTASRSACLGWKLDWRAKI